MLYWVLFGFVALGAKLILAAITIYLLLPTDRRCNGCDDETLLLRMERGSRLLSLVLLGRIQRRWCPRCGWEGLARGRWHPILPPLRRPSRPSSPVQRGPS